MPAPLDAVTGAFSHSGRCIALRLLARGRRVRTLTGHPERAGVFGGEVKAFPYDFERPDRLAASLKGVDTLYNNYWVRFDHGGMTYEKAVADSRVLVAAAAKAGVRRLVQVSIANPSPDSPFRYYKGKAAVEEAVRGSGLAYSILRPTVLFGPDGILINNIAWLLRRFPFFLVPGDGRYRIQPVYVEDLADLAVAEGEASGARELDAVGPETFTYEDLVRAVAAAVGRKARLVHAGRGTLVAAARVLGRLTGDVVLTPDEVDGLMADLLYSRKPATCRTALTRWMAENGAELGRRYLSELALHFDKAR